MGDVDMNLEKLVKEIEKMTFFTANGRRYIDREAVVYRIRRFAHG